MVSLRYPVVQVDVSGSGLPDARLVSFDWVVLASRQTTLAADRPQRAWTCKHTLIHPPSGPQIRCPNPPDSSHPSEVLESSVLCRHNSPLCRVAVVWVLRPLSS